MSSIMKCLSVTVVRKIGTETGAISNEPKLTGVGSSVSKLSSGAVSNEPKLAGAGSSIAKLNSTISKL